MKRTGYIGHTLEEWWPDAVAQMKELSAAGVSTRGISEIMRRNGRAVGRMEVWRVLRRLRRVGYG